VALHLKASSKTSAQHSGSTFTAALVLQSAISPARVKTQQIQIMMAFGQNTLLSSTCRFGTIQKDRLKDIITRVHKEVICS
jgi:hypothetical protein